MFYGLRLLSLLSVFDFAVSVNASCSNSGHIHLWQALSAPHSQRKLLVLPLDAWRHDRHCCGHFLLSTHLKLQGFVTWALDVDARRQEASNCLEVLGTWVVQCPYLVHHGMFVIKVHLEHRNFCLTNLVAFEEALVHRLDLDAQALELLLLLVFQFQEDVLVEQGVVCRRDVILDRRSSLLTADVNLDEGVYTTLSL